jgi:hypothetical protein
MTHEAIILANDRPTSCCDTLYQWAVDAEEMLRKLAQPAGQDRFMLPLRLAEVLGQEGLLDPLADGARTGRIVRRLLAVMEGEIE